MIHPFFSASTVVMNRDRSAEVVNRAHAMAVFVRLALRRSSRMGRRTPIRCVFTAPIIRRATRMAELEISMLSHGVYSSYLTILVV